MRNIAHTFCSLLFKQQSNKPSSVYMMSSNSIASLSLRVQLKRSKQKSDILRMIRKKSLNQKPQIRAYPSNPCHPCSFRFDDYYFISTNTHLRRFNNRIIS
jgi:hypothetical protein